MPKIVNLLLVLPIIFALFGGLANAASVDYSYKIHPGDVLQITVWKEDSLDKEVLVLPDGTITFPLIGSFSVKGMTPSTAEKVIKTKLANIIPDASVAVLIKAPLGHSVNVIGQVVKSGEIMMGHRLSVMQALSQAGGLTPYADEDSIIVIHHDSNNKETSTPFPYNDVVSGQKLDKDIILQPGDIVVVPTASLFR